MSGFLGKESKQAGKPASKDVTVMLCIHLMCVVASNHEKLSQDLHEPIPMIQFNFALVLSRGVGKTF